MLQSSIKRYVILAMITLVVLFSIFFAINELRKGTILIKSDPESTVSIFNDQGERIWSAIGSTEYTKRLPSASYYIEMSNGVRITRKQAIISTRQTFEVTTEYIDPISLVKSGVLGTSVGFGDRALTLADNTPVIKDLHNKIFAEEYDDNPDYVVFGDGGTYAAVTDSGNLEIATSSGRFIAINQLEGLADEEYYSPQSSRRVLSVAYDKTNKQFCTLLANGEVYSFTPAGQGEILTTLTGSYNRLVCDAGVAVVGTSLEPVDGERKKDTVGSLFIIKDKAVRELKVKNSTSFAIGSSGTSIAINEGGRVQLVDAETFKRSFIMSTKNPNPLALHFEGSALYVIDMGTIWKTDVKTFTSYQLVSGLDFSRITAREFKDDITLLSIPGKSQENEVYIGASFTEETKKINEQLRDILPTKTFDYRGEVFFDGNSFLVSMILLGDVGFQAESTTSRNALNSFINTLPKSNLISIESD